MRPEVKAFFDKDTWTLSYVVFDASTADAVIIDPVWNYDPASSKLSTGSIEELLRFVDQSRLKIHYILETHAHADHLSGSQVLKEKLRGVPLAIGSRIREVQKVFKSVFNLGSEFRDDGSQFDKLLEDDETVSAGSLSLRALFTPGHTPACASYVIGDAIFTGDALFMPDYGTGRCDFPAGSASDLYRSVHDKLYKLPGSTRVFTGHDYLPGGRELRYESTIEEERTTNIHLREVTNLDSFIRFRQERDATLSAPKLLLPSVQVNIRGGHLPPADSNGIRYLKIPLN